MRSAAAAAGALAHGLGLAYVVSDTDGLGVGAGAAATLGYLAAVALLGASSSTRLAFAIVLAESAAALVVGMVVGGFDNEAWGAGIVLITLVAVVTLAIVAAARALRASRRSRLSSSHRLRRRE